MKQEVPVESKERKLANGLHIASRIAGLFGISLLIVSLGAWVRAQGSVEMNLLVGMGMLFAGICLHVYINRRNP